MMKAISILAISLLAWANASALHVQPDLKKVPIAKLISNLEKQAKREPGNVETLHHLARAHAMAWSQKLPDKAKVNQHEGKDGIWFGYQPSFVPYARTKKQAADQSARQLAASHLANAIAYYQAALKIKSSDPTLQLGHGWCLEQSDQKAEAITAYRNAIKRFWKDDKSLRTWFGPVGTLEASGYLIPLLDSKKDAREIANLKSKVAKIQGLPRLMTLKEIIAPDARVAFDVDGSGRRDSWSWITPKAAWLVYDHEGTGQIDSAIQLFGNRTFMLFLEDGYAAMRLLDENDDDQLDGPELVGLALWHDQNSNGHSDPGEVQSVTSHGIDRLATRPTTHASGIPYAPYGMRFNDGTTRPTFDVLLERD
jgi:tetratricopeptide (TPR) repeat protein